MKVDMKTFGIRGRHGGCIATDVDAREFLAEELEEQGNPFLTTWYRFTLPRGTRIAVCDGLPEFEGEMEPSEVEATIIECTEDTLVLCREPLNGTLGYVDGALYLKDSEGFVSLRNEPREVTPCSENRLFQDYCQFWGVNRIVATL